ncbi:MAG: bacterial Ig-like domain-containing protein [Clostridiales bacterium]|nr:bacterial Ig-like domain-containing protein [Clostridiales bacterium]
MKGKITINKMLGLFAVITAMLLSVFAVAACAEDGGASVTLELDTSEVRTTFGVGEAFTADGLKVVAVIDGERYVATYAECDISVPDMSKPGEKTVTVTFMKATASYTITVVDVEITELVLDTSGVKTEFVQGEAFSAAGLIVTPILSFGESKPVKLSECEITGFDSETVGEKVITVTYRGVKATYKVNVVALSPKELAFEFNGVKTVYAVGESFDGAGLTVTVVMNDGSTRPVTEFNVQSAPFTEPGNTAVTVTATYNGQNVGGSFNVCVLPKAVSEYSANQVLAFTNTGDGGEELTLYITNIEGGGANSVPAHTYGWTVLKKSDGTAVMDEFEYTYTPANWASEFIKCVGSVNIASDGALRITVGGAEFRAGDSLWHYVVIGWDELEYITVDSTYAKTEYYVGDAFDFGGVAVILHRMSGATERVEVTAVNATFSGFDGSSAGEKTITVTYEGKSATYKVTVYAVEIASIELNHTNVKKQYLVGDEFTAAGLAVTAVMNNGTRSGVDISECAFSGYDLSEAGEYDVVVSYEGKTASYHITVTEPLGVLTEITLDYSSAQTQFTAGDTFTAAGLIVTAKFDDGSSEQVDISACTFSGYDMNVEGSYTVTVSYGGKTATYQITVGAPRLERIEVDYSGAERREYVVGMQFTSNGIVVTAHYSNGTTKTLEAEEYEVSSPDMTTVGVKTVTVSYGQKTAEYMIYAIPDVNWDTRKLDLSNQSGTGDTLELFVTDIQGGGNWGTSATTTGWYLLKRTDGTYEMYEFRFTYVPDRNPQCEFMTEGLDAEYLDNNQGGDMFVVIGSLTFRANADYWHNRVMGW